MVDPSLSGLELVDVMAHPSAGPDGRSEETHRPRDEGATGVLGAAKQEAGEACAQAEACPKSAAMSTATSRRVAVVPWCETITTCPSSVVSQRTKTARARTGSRLRLATRPTDLEEDSVARRCSEASGSALCASVEAGCPSRKMGRVLQQRTGDPTGG